MRDFFLEGLSIQRKYPCRYPPGFPVADTGSGGLPPGKRYYIIIKVRDRGQFDGTSGRGKSPSCISLENTRRTGVIPWANILGR